MHERRRLVSTTDIIFQSQTKSTAPSCIIDDLISKPTTQKYLGNKVVGVPSKLCQHVNSILPKPKAMAGC